MNVEIGPLVAVAVGDSDGVRVDGPDVAWPVFSVTKMFVAVATLRLAESGGLQLTDAVDGWLPQAPPGITVRELLGHAAGLPDYPTTAPYREAVATQPSCPWGLERILEVALAGEPSPRGQFRYSNAGYWLLGAVLERVAAESLDDVLAAAVFGPAAMTSTYYPAVGVGLTEAGYDTRWAGPAGAAWSTPADVVGFLTALFAGSLLSPASLAEMMQAVPVSAGEPWREPGYGLGLMVDAGHGTFGHGGGGPGYTSAAFTLPATGRSVALIAPEAADADTTELALHLLEVRP